MFCSSPLLSNINVIPFYKVLNIGIIIISPIPSSFLFTPPLPSNPIITNFLRENDPMADPGGDGGVVGGGGGGGGWGWGLNTPPVAARGLSAPGGRTMY